MTYINETHDPQMRSWVSSANDPATDFPVQNLPFAAFRFGHAGWRCGVAIGDQVVDLAAVAAAGLFDGLAADAAAAGAQPALNDLMALGPQAWSALRLALSRALRQGAPAQDQMAACLVPQARCDFAVPARVGDYTDFYTSIHHATNVGRLFRPDNPLMPNYQWLPVGYHGRASSVVVSGVDFVRPRGQVLDAATGQPALVPSRRLDFELEMGVFIGMGNALGEPVSVNEADHHVFGLCLLNDWSARDLQAWEYQPLGPFLAKNFATTVSPWVVTLEALAPFRVAHVRPETAPAPLEYLSPADGGAQQAFDIRLQATLETATMRQQGLAPQVVSDTNYKYAFWTASQMVAHHTVNGCNLQPGDLLGTGTLSGPEPSQAAALIELTSGGKAPLSLASGESRTFLEDHDAVTLLGWCEKAGVVRIGFGACTGRVLPARS